MERTSSVVIQEGGAEDSVFDDDGRLKRTGTVVTASAHIIRALIGSGVLLLAWAMAQLGAIAGPIVLIVFSVITLYTSILLTDCYRSPDGTRNHSYMDAVRTHLGGKNFMFCAIAQYATLIGLSTGYAITTALSLGAIERTICYHKKGRQRSECTPSTRNYILEFGVLQIILSQIPNIRKLSFVSVVASLMSFSYSLIGVALSAARIASMPRSKSKLCAKLKFEFFVELIFVHACMQDTLRASPREKRVMKEATCVGIAVSSVFYALCGALGYAAFGIDASGNLLTDDHAFYEPYWLLAFANACIAVHLVGAYQVFSQPVFAFVEGWCRRRWGEGGWVMRGAEYELCGGTVEVSPFRFLWRSSYVAGTVAAALVFPFFNAFVGLLGAISFWPLTIYFPIEMYIVKGRVRKWSLTWGCLQGVSFVCLLVSLLAAAGSVRNLIKSLMHYKPFAS
ncbi:hypothetical protein DM860_003162 [Cuscuta australis]|uniref:Amino acid transporter transmembrane domain-containing protein n=1 Tax=Cuscuta australis TaxID=267555 RepID=A0A328D5H3_9ASTE|nr:hypothetical protein DM860_003162 [Cuscuta australis]